MNILLVNEQVLDSRVFIDSVNTNTRAILYGNQTDLLQELQSTGPIEQLGIVFVKGMLFMGKRFEDQVDLLNAAISQFQIKRIDFLACNTLPDWSDFYAKLNTVVGASSDLTGNLKYGGNWVMESTGQDIETVYFTHSIEYYKYLLDFGGGEVTYVLKDDNKLYMKGFNRETQQGIDNKLIIKDLTPVNITLDASAKIVAHESTTYILTNNKVYVAGDDGPNDMRALSRHPSVIANLDPYYKDLFDRNTTGQFIEIPTDVSGNISDIAVNRYGCMILIDFVPYYISFLPWTRATNDRFTKIDILDSSGTILTATKLWGSNSRYFASTSDGLYAVGLQSYGALGTRSTDALTWFKMTLPSSPSGIITEISSSEDGVLMIMDGILYMLGYNGTGRFGPPVQTEVNVFTKVKYNNVDTSGVTHVSMYNSLIVYAMSGKLYRNNVEVPLPSSAIGGTIEKLSTGIDHFLVVISGRLYGMGKTSFCQLGTTNRIKSGLISLDVVTPTELLMNGASISPSQVLATPFSGSFVVVSGILYAMGRNPYGALGIRNVMRTDTLMPVQYNGQDITSVTKAYSRNNKTILAAGGEIYVSGSAADGSLGVPYFFIAWQLPELFSTGNFIKPVLPVGSSGTIQYVRVGTGSSSYFVRGGKVYGTGNETLVGSTTFKELPLPSGVTGTIDGFEAGSGYIVLIVGGKLYGLGINSNYCLGRNDNSRVTTISSCDSSTFITQNVIMVSCTQWYETRDYTIFVQKDPVTNLYTLYGMGDTYGLIRSISFPGGVPTTSTIDSISSGLDYSIVIFGGKLYRLKNGSWTGPLQLGGVDITNAKEISCSGNGNDRVLIGQNLYARGSNLYKEVATTGSDLDWTFITDGLAGGSVSIESVSRMNGTTNTAITLAGTLLNSITSIVLDINSTTVVSGSALTCTIGARTATSLTFTIPAGNGNKWIKLVTADKNYVVPGVFAYRNPIVPIGIFDGEFAITPVSKNQIVNIKADYLTDLSGIRFNGTLTKAFTIISPTECSVIVPDGTSGYVILEDIYGVTSAPIEAMSILYSTMTATSISPTTGKAGDSITITGTNLRGVNAIYFGNTKVNITPSNTNIKVVQAPVELGTVSIRLYDSYNNMVTAPQTFTYTIEPTQEAVVQAIVQSSTMDASGQKFYAISEGVNYFIVKNNATGPYTKLYSNGTNPIKGIAIFGTTLYFCDPVTNSIRSFLSTTSAMLVSADAAVSTVLQRVSMLPEAIKTDGTKLYIVCKSVGDGTKDAIVIANMDGSSPTAQPYSGFSGYTLQGITYYTLSSVLSLYVSAVVYPIVSTTVTTGVIFKLNSTGGSSTSFVTGLKNPIDLAFTNGYLIIDGPITVVTPIGQIISSYDTTANSIVTTDTVISFTVNNTVTGSSVVNQLTIPPYIDNTFKLTDLWTPKQGPVGTVVSIAGYNMTDANVTTVKLQYTLAGAAKEISVVPTTGYQVTQNQIFVRMPKLEVGSSRDITIVINGTKSYPYGYRDSDLVNIIPLYEDGQKYYHFTGNSLHNIQYIEFVTANVTTMSANKIAVRNVTATSFDATIPSPPLNIARCLLQDSFGNLTQEDADFFTLSSETCFPGDTPILTDQGSVPIEKIDREYHTIGKKEIMAITKIKYSGDTLIFLAKDSLRKNYPTRDTIISRKHKIYYKGKMKRAEQLLGKGAQVIPYKKQFLYNVLLKNHETMNVNGLICETLYPKNPIAKFFNSEM
jgi:alpha-tubulin suppressor-like RCC1 family protein